jgi:hypothetical protein
MNGHGANGPVIDLQEARSIILDMISNDMSSFELRMTAKHNEEYVDVRIGYDICGVHYEKDEGQLKLIVNINRKKPAEVMVDMSTLYDDLEKDTRERLPFLLRNTYYISIDRRSMMTIYKTTLLETFREELANAIENSGFTRDEVLPILMEYIRGTIGGTSFNSIDELIHPGIGHTMPVNRPIIEITPPGVPCPHCHGLLSEDALKDLLLRLYMKRHEGGEHDY